MHRAARLAVLLIGVNDVTGAVRTATTGLARELLSAALPVHPVVFAFDGLHPNWLAYQHWATQLAGRIRELESHHSPIGC
jgi:lysophospholipase L1-like esterase